VLGVLCNALVCLGVWLAAGARSLTDRLVAVVPPVTPFVALGLEHVVANMFFVPLAIFARAWAPPHGALAAAELPDPAWGLFLTHNLVPVTAGNVVGGAGLVGLVYWFAYVRPRRRVPPPAAVAPGAALPPSGPDRAAPGDGG
jgi:formate transporter